MFIYHTLSTASYESLRYQTVLQLEGSDPKPYFDTQASPAPTIGIGFELKTHLTTILELWGFDRFNPVHKVHMDAMQAIVDNPPATEAQLIAALDQAMNASMADVGQGVTVAGIAEDHWKARAIVSKASESSSGSEE